MREPVQLNYNPLLNVTVDFTNKFAALDRITNSLSEYLTNAEVDKIVSGLDAASKSKYDGNWSEGDAFQYLQDTLGRTRYDLLLETVRQAQESRHLQGNDNFREAWYHKLTMQEVPFETTFKNPDMYTSRFVPKEQ